MPRSRSMSSTRRHAGLGTIVECQRQVEHAAYSVRSQAGWAGGDSSAAFWPARDPVCQIAALRSIHLMGSVEGNRHRKHQQNAGKDMRAVENGAAARDEIADAGGRNQHLGHDDADDHERAADAQLPTARSGSPPG